MPDHYTVKIIDEGRSGYILYSEGLLHSHSFYWEFGGGEAVVLIRIPTTEEWPSALPWAAKRRDEIIDRLTAEACRQRCRGCRPKITDGWIELLEP